MTVAAPRAGPFTGVFDGGGKKVTLDIGREGDPANGGAGSLGLFGVLNGALVGNLVIDGTLFAEGQGGIDAGAVAGQAYNSTVRAVASHAIITIRTGGNGRTGGIAGQAFNLTVEDSYSSGNITALAEGAAYAGGIIGSAGDGASGSRVTVNRCFSLSEISATGGTAAGTGGILSLVNPATAGAVNNCAALNGGITTGSASPSRGRIVNIASQVKLSNNHANGGMSFDPGYAPSGNPSGPDGAAAAIQAVRERSWWTETLRWPFGSGSNAPWSWGEGVPKLWFE